jgi:CheY-like chemotaxis protein
LMDVESPSAQGWDILRMLKVDPDTRDIPVVICSWLDDEAHSLKEGAEAHLRKPVMYDDIVTALRDVGIRIGQD